MELNTKANPLIRKESRLQRWFNNLFCIQSETDCEPLVLPSRHKSLKIKQKQTISMSLLGSYKNSILCKISRKNFIVSENQLDGERLPSCISKYIGDKLSSPTVLVKGNISKIMVARIPLVVRLASKGDKVEKYRQFVYSNIMDLKIRMDDLAIFRPKFPANATPSLLDSDEIIAKQIACVVRKFRNSIIILPSTTNLDEIGLVLSSVPKFVQVQTIVANGSPLCVAVYIGSKQFVLISEPQQLAFVAKELKKDLQKDTTNILQLVQKIYQRSSLADVLFLLRKSINESDVDTICSCFIRNAIFRNYITNEEVSELVPDLPNQIEIPHTASFRLTARFNHQLSENYKRSYSEDMLNGENGQLHFENEVETFAGSGASLNEEELNGRFTPYDSNQ